MLNQVVIVGRVGNVYYADGIAEIRVPRTGDIDIVDIIPCTLTDNIMNYFKEYCKQGDIVGIKGRLVNRDSSLFLSADKVTFLSSSAMKGGDKDDSNE